MSDDTTTPSPHPFRLREGDAMAFDDQGEHVPVVWPSADEPLERQLLDTLLDAGATFPNVPRALAAIQTAFDMAGDARAAEAIARILARLPNTRRGAELRAVLLDAVDADGAEQARRFGVTKQGWHQCIQRLKKRVFGKNR